MASFFSSRLLTGSLAGSQVSRQLSDGAKESAHIRDMLSSGRISAGEAQRMTISQKIRQESKRLSYQDSDESLRAHMVRSEYKTTSGLLQEALNESPKRNDLSYYVLQQLGIIGVQQVLAKERKRRAAPTFQQPFPLLASIVFSAVFEIIVGVIMCFNGVMVGVQVSRDLPEELFYMEALEHFFTAFFVAEVILRLLVCGWIWICSPGNFLDSLVIFVTGVLPMWILQPMGVGMADLRVVQTLRTLRLMRLIRIVRERRFFRTPFKLFQGLADSLHMIFHVYVVIGTATFIFAVYGVYFIGRSGCFQPGSPLEHTDEAWPEARDLALKAFATVPRSTFTVFQVMTLDSWSLIARPLMKYTIGVPCLFAAVIMVNAIVLQNLITAVIVNNALQCAKQDEELIAMEKREAAERDLEDLRGIFWSLKAVGGGNFLSEEGFLSAARTDRRLRNKLQLLHVLPTEAYEVWELLTKDDERLVHVERFANVMRQLGSEAKSKDSFACAQHLRRLNRRMERLKRRLADHKKRVEALQLEADAASKDFGGFLREAHEFVRYVGVCIPGSPVSRGISKLTTRFALPWREEGEEVLEPAGL